MQQSLHIAKLKKYLAFLFLIFYSITSFNYAILYLGHEISHLISHTHQHSLAEHLVNMTNSHISHKHLLLVNLALQEQENKDKKENQLNLSSLQKLDTHKISEYCFTDIKLNTLTFLNLKIVESHSLVLITPPSPPPKFS